MRKYDCSKTLDLVHEVKRICKSTDDIGDPSCDCGRCILKGHRCDNLFEYTQEGIDIVQKWSDEHPQMTRMDKFKELLKGTEFEGMKFFILGFNESWWNEPYEELGNN